ncbi:alpha-glucuronidase [Oscillospiraceae bacterium HV4-5-C5C]|nr:alpha-glucuronidase [Oscillospiraceae bacterium HV4-5-C5C]
MDGYLAWLNYADQTPETWTLCQEPPVEDACLKNAKAELQRAWGPESPGAVQGWQLSLQLDGQLNREAYQIQRRDRNLSLSGGSTVGLLYACFALIRCLRLGQLTPDQTISQSPATSLRMINHWDNLDGSIERGYAGQSFFFRDNQLLLTERTQDYCRLAASIGINAIVINNVNVGGEASWLISSRHYPSLAELSRLMWGYGIRLFLSIDFAAPIVLGGLESADPLDPEVIAWWGRKVNEVYAALPQLGGFLVKADSEGRPGPFTYGRDQSQGANMLGRALAPHQGLLIWRAFVYNARQDWRDHKTDRARAAYDYFAPLDGHFADNVYLQIKNGPMDFQVREPVSPLFSRLRQTHLILELQIAQEYTGQQIDVCYLGSEWREILDFHTANPAALPGKDRVSDLITQSAWPGLKAGIAAVANTGSDRNWFGHDLAGLNYYAYGILAWNPAGDVVSIAADWLRQSLPSLSESATKALLSILTSSWRTYESYTAPLGIGWMVSPQTHYGPAIDGYEYDRWGTYHRADHWGLGVERGPQGTGYSELYPETLAARYRTVTSCPDELSLFFHYRRYTDRLHSGKTVIQHIYDSHFDGAAAAETYLETWRSLQSELDPELYERVEHRLEQQVANAREWRDQINSYFWRKSAIADEKKRVIY